MVNWDLDARFIIVEDDFMMMNPMVIKDIGPWNKRLSVTNDAKRVVEQLVREGCLKEGRRLLYYDSRGELAELIVKEGKFVGFRCADE